MLPTNLVLVGDRVPDDITDTWHVVVDGGDGEQFISVDLHPDRLGRCYDSFEDVHGMPGSCPGGGPLVHRAARAPRGVPAEGTGIGWSPASSPSATPPDPTDAQARHRDCCAAVEFIHRP